MSWFEKKQTEGDALKSGSWDLEKLTGGNVHQVNKRRVGMMVKTLSWSNTHELVTWLVNIQLSVETLDTSMRRRVSERYGLLPVGSARRQ
jgi:hypothetical protein